MVLASPNPNQPPTHAMALDAETAVSGLGARGGAVGLGLGLGL